MLRACFPQSYLEALSRLSPACVFRFCTSIDGSAILFDFSGDCLMLVFCAFKRSFGLRHRRFAACANLCRRSLFFPTLLFPAVSFSSCESLMERLLLAPHASSAAFIEGAAIARS
jgi:hypothetical protein